jgi:hypothetical protein
MPGPINSARPEVQGTGDSEVATAAKRCKEIKERVDAERKRTKAFTAKGRK